MTTRAVSPADVLFTPPEAASAALRALEYRRAHRGDGIYFGLDEIDQHMTPLLPDNLVTIIGRPRNGKTAVMLWWARQQAARLAAAGVQNRAVVYITYEQSAEDLTAFQAAADARVSIDGLQRGTLADGDWQKVVASLTGAVVRPLAIIGHSAERRQRRPRLTLTHVGQTIEYMIDTLKISPHMVFVDYLQRIPAERRQDRRLEVSEALDRCKDACLAYGVPWVVGVQARREVDRYDVQIPQIADGQETANIEQASDKIFTLVRPCLYRKQGESFGSITVEGKRQMLVTLAKQKTGDDNTAQWVEFDMGTNTLMRALVEHHVKLPSYGKGRK